jgi:hypothetical protein
MITYLPYSHPNTGIDCDLFNIHNDQEFVYSFADQGFLRTNVSFPRVVSFLAPQLQNAST